MSSFYCEKCGAMCQDTDRGYITGCEHYPPDATPRRGQSTLEAVAMHFEQVEQRKAAIREAESVSDTLKWFYGLQAAERAKEE